MSDKISSITNGVDRAGLNVSGLKNGKKKIVLSICAALGLIAVVVGVGVAKSRFEDSLKSNGEEATQTADAANVEQGATRTSVETNSNWIEQAKEKARRKNQPEPKPKAKPTVEETKTSEVKKDVEKYVEAKPEPRPEPKVRFTNSNAKPEDNEPPPPTQEELDLARRLSGSLSSGDDSSSSQNVDPNDYADNQSAAEYDNTFDGSLFKSTKATVRRKGERNFLLAHGSSIPCALYNQIISEYDGYVTCRVTQDVYSSNGAVLLVERGSLVSGTQNVSLEPGKGRVFTNWGEIETPSGVVVRIDSLGTGQLGAAGNDVWIDNHYFERFSGAIMLSFVDDALATAMDSLSNRNFSTDSSVDNVGNIAEQVLSKNLDIAPTGYTKIGQRINIQIVRDVDFSTVYGLEAH